VANFLIFATHSFFLVLLSGSIHFRLFNRFVINFQDEGQFLLIVCLKSWLVFILLNKKCAPKMSISSAT
jgi:hypothetical protein